MAKELKKNKAQMVMPESKEDKKKALESAIAHILKTYGSGAVMRLGQANTMQVDAIPTGSMTLDLALGIGFRILPIRQYNLPYQRPYPQLHSCFQWL